MKTNDVEILVIGAGNSSFEQGKQGSLRGVRSKSFDLGFQVLANIDGRGYGRQCYRLPVIEKECRGAVVQLLCAMRLQSLFKLILIAVAVAWPEMDS